MAAEPLLDMVRVLAKLVDAKGRVTAPGFYESVRMVEPAEQAMYTEIKR